MNVYTGPKAQEEDSNLKSEVAKLKAKDSSLYVTFNSHDSRIASNAHDINLHSASNLTRDTEITAIKTTNTSQATKITAIETKNTSQDSTITALTARIAGL